ncbi:YeiH family putative sulfate export transporter, partial [Salmonella enterica subsp. enterica serovar Lubbock]|nr:YeiH family putative sulfate export transporter [Salmonella enterica subsp. enterica serovar Lubbock]
ELDDDQGWQFYSQRNTDGSISFRVNGQMEPNSYSNTADRRRNGRARPVIYAQRPAPAWRHRSLFVLTLSSTFMLACFLGQKVFGLDRHTSWLIGAGSSICGAAAVLATEPVVKAEASKVTVAVATVVIFGTIAIFLYPAMYPLLAHWFSPETYGIYIGSTMHEVAQVVAAGHAVSPDAENAAVIAKMLRVMMLAPFLIILAARVKQLSPATGAEKSKITIPWFAIFFIVVAIFNSFHLLPKAVVDMLVTLDTVLLAMAMAALGLTTHVSALKKAGAKPLLMALALFAWLIIGGGAINVLIHSLIA